MTNKPTMEDWEENFNSKFLNHGEFVYNRGGYPVTCGEIKQFIKDLLAKQSEEWQGETLDERCDWHKDVEGGFHCQYCCPICNPELKNTGGKE